MVKPQNGFLLRSYLLPQYQGKISPRIQGRTLFSPSPRKQSNSEQPARLLFSFLFREEGNPHEVIAPDLRITLPTDFFTYETHCFQPWQAYKFAILQSSLICGCSKKRHSAIPYSIFSLYHHPEDFIFAPGLLG